MPDELLDALSVVQREAFWRDGLAGQDPPLVLVAERDGEVVGFCAAQAPSRDADAEEAVAEIGAIYVEPAVWRAGVGRRLMERALTELHSAGWEAVTLWVLAANQGAREFYARFGLEPDGAQTTHEASGLAEIRLRGSVHR